MFKTFINAFKIKDIRKKLFYTLMILVVIRIGSQIPLPGIDGAYVQEIMKSLLGEGGGGIISAITGGSLERMSILALGITPYITSSIVMQLLTIAIPALEEMQRDGDDGRKKIAAITRYLTVALALIESGAMAISYKGILMEPFRNALGIICVIAAMTAGSAFLMWLGERVTENGVGNGISIVLVINIISTFPQDAVAIYERVVTGEGGKASSIPSIILKSAIALIVVILMIIAVIVLNDAVRKIPIQYAKRIQGNRMMGGNSTSIPVKVNTAGVIPVIFAASLMQFPGLITNMVTNGQGTKNHVWGEILKYIGPHNWFKSGSMIYTLGIFIYVLLVVFFAYFYTSITFNPVEIANNLKKAGGFVPGIRPGKPTSEYLNTALNYIIFIGAVGLTIVAVIPYIITGLTGVALSFGGTSIIIVVSVVIETAQQVESQMLVRNYKGFLNE